MRRGEAMEGEERGKVSFTCCLITILLLFGISMEEKRKAWVGGRF